MKLDVHLLNKKVVENLNVPDTVNVTIWNSTYHDAFTALLDHMDENDLKLAPMFAFIDPFGIKGLPLSTIKRLMEHRGCEVFITFMVGFINRFISTPEFMRHCDELFGTDQWRYAIDLDGPQRESYLRNLYQKQLLDAHSGVGAKYVRYFTMKNAKNRTIYDLFFATNHPKGIDSMKDAMWNIDQSGDYTFSDATDPDQETLFTSEPDWNQLIDMLIGEFGTVAVPWPSVEEAIRRSPFRILKTPLKTLSKTKNPRLEILNPKGSTRGVINNATHIKFLR